MFSIENGEIFEGDIPKKEQQWVKKFIDCYRKELIEMWKSQQFETLPFGERVEKRGKYDSSN